jgi:hypothetical protein
LQHNPRGDRHESLAVKSLPFAAVRTDDETVNPVDLVSFLKVFQ